MGHGAFNLQSFKPLNTLGTSNEAAADVVEHWKSPADCCQARPQMTLAHHLVYSVGEARQNTSILTVLLCRRETCLAKSMRESRSKTRKRKIAEGGTRRVDSTWLHGLPEVGPIGATRWVPDCIPRNGVQSSCRGEGSESTSISKLENGHFPRTLEADRLNWRNCIDVGEILMRGQQPAWRFGSHWCAL